MPGEQPKGRGSQRPRDPAVLGKVTKNVLTPKQLERTKKAQKLAAEAVARKAAESNELTPLQQRFLEEYVRFGMGSHLRAYEAATNGQNTKATCYTESLRLIKLPKVAARVAEIDAQRRQTARMSGEDILRELEKIAMSNPEDFIRVVDGRPILDMTNVTRDQMAAITEVASEETTTTNPTTGNTAKTIWGKIKLGDKRAALELLGKTRQHRLFVDSKEIAGPDGQPLLPPSLTIVFTDDPAPDHSKLAAESEGDKTT